MIEIKKSKYGRGVFSKRFISKDTLIESSFLIEIPKDEEKILDSTIFSKYLFKFDSTIYFALGFGSLFNHSDNENVYCQYNKKTKQIDYFTKIDVESNQELFINYGYNVFDVEKHYLRKKQTFIKKLKN